MLQFPTSCPLCNPLQPLCLNIFYHEGPEVLHKEHEENLFVTTKGDPKIVSDLSENLPLPAH